MEYQKIFLPTRPQPDTIIGIFLLKTFGNEKYAGIENAVVEILTTLPEGKTEESFLQEGIFLIDIGKGKFDHHVQGKTVSQLVVEDLAISDTPALAKLLAYAERDDKYGKGTISQDPLDKAFGLSGLTAALNKTLPQHPDDIVNYILPLLTAHYIEEKKRTEDLPREYEEKTKQGKTQEFSLKHKGKPIKVVAIESNEPSMAGWLRSSVGKKADVVVQKMDAGYVNIMTRPLKKIDLRETAALIRKEEIARKNRELPTNAALLFQPGRIPEVPEWYYDRATNSLLNGAINPKGVSPTLIPFERIQELVTEGLGQSAQLLTNR